MLAKIRSILKNKGYIIYTRPYELDIVGLRSKQTRANKFDDEIHVFYKKDKSKWNYHLYKATTDPGTFWLNNPSYPEGTAILKEGQNKNAYAIGLHKGKYKALLQIKPVTVMRDYDRNAILDFRNGIAEKGMFGINIHRANSKGKTLYIDSYSAGCQVFQSAEAFQEFMELCEKHKERYGNIFTYTLIDFRAVRKITLKRIAIVASFLSSLIVGYFFKENRKRS
jgi:hypothetical protein